MKRTTGWLLEMAGGLQTAIGRLELRHLMDNVTPHEIPCTPPHCRHVIEWQGRFLPLWDVAVYLHGAMREDFSAVPARDATVIPVVAIVAYEARSNGALRYGALRLERAPVKVTTTDAAACELPSDLPAWGHVAIACFAHGGRAVPVLDVPRLFSRALVQGHDIGASVSTEFGTDLHKAPGYTLA